jgi:hypothetical protein
MNSHAFKLLAVLALVALNFAAHAAEGDKLKLLLFSGANNHNWKATTPVLQKMYEDSGRFAVTVTEDVPHLAPAEFAKYDAIVCNYTSYPNVLGHRWPDENGRERGHISRFKRERGHISRFKN